MVHACVSQLVGTDTGCFYSFRNKGVNIVELRLAQLNVNTAQNINGIGYGLPVKGHIILNLQIQVAVQGFDGLLRSAYKVSLVDLGIGSLIVDI